MKRTLVICCAALTTLAAAQKSPAPVGQVRNVVGELSPIYAFCTSPQAGQKGLAGNITIPSGTESGCSQKRVKAHVEWAWAKPPGTVAVHGYWVKDSTPLRAIEKQLKAGGWKLDGRFPMGQSEQVRYVKPGQEITLQYDQPMTFFFPDYKREGPMLSLSLRRY